MLHADAKKALGRIMHLAGPFLSTWGHFRKAVAVDRKSRSGSEPYQNLHLFNHII
jgi:hypothetical protein